MQLGAGKDFIYWGAVIFSYVLIPTNDTYVIYIEADNGGVVYIDSALIVDDTGMQKMCHSAKLLVWTYARSCTSCFVDMHEIESNSAFVVRHKFGCESLHHATLPS